MSILNFERSVLQANFAGKATHLNDNNSDWIVDSGASDNMISPDHALIDIETPFKIHPVNLPNGASISISSIGKTKLSQV